MLKNSNEDYYKTTDLNICVILQYFNHQLITIDKSDNNRCLFFLEDDEGTARILKDFYQEKLFVEPKRFVSIQKETKSRIYN